MRIIIGSDHRGKEIFNLVVEYIRNNTDHLLTLANDFESKAIDYPDIGIRVARDVGSGKFDCGILICGTGIGMCVVANKFPGVRAAPCNNEVVAELARKHNDSNVLCLAGDMLGEGSSLRIVEKWLSTKFLGGRHAFRLEQIRELEKRNYSPSKVGLFEDTVELGSPETEDSAIPCANSA